MPQRKPKRTKDRCTIERVYRKLLAVEKDIVNQLAIIRLDLRPVREHVPILTQHCERLMREKITLQKQVESANRYMAQEPIGTCIDCGGEFRPPHECTASRKRFEREGLELVDLRNPKQNERRREEWEKKAADILNSSFAEDWGKMVSIARPTKCAFTHLHRPGIRCAVCHHMEINYGQ
jgi:hypothetical protein